MSICQNLMSLDLVVPPQRTVPLKRERPEFSHFSLNGTTASCLPPLKELRLNVNPRRIMVQEDECLNLLAGFQWSSIEKLDISSDRLTETLLPRFGAEMVKLQSLSIIVLYLKRNGLWAASEQSLLAVSDLLAKRSFVELELDGFNKTLPIRHVASVHLRKLRLHMIELDHTIARANLRSAAEIQELAELAPNLEHLMLDVAHVGKLWHPSAIPGVDVDVHLYQVLGAFSKFRHLKTLRLFPRYYCADENGQGLWQQAIDDDGQAVRIFKYLKSISPSLELLVLSSDHLVAQFADIDPMSWTVCQFGDCILLRLQQANKNYEQKQIWQGQRRLRTEIKRYSHSKLRWTS
ncbi:hypothetical protein EPUS_09125 [Endocarpon pusillum Z07020]|uniref:F-box domain-containing protein n=1 Tax=Endocarpon pusillum (strain Z07020 / HMAS-L-300199) TaxID=1263415 RepID=U1G6X3_ENDPU|nr:uncharacterized protein EPUS_09125 [Endocarpon pusillum Z07020]ERF73127.1 hypothetical protein EPUS_09125 [Endocarpon pusillum Z07020]